MIFKFMSAPSFETPRALSEIELGERAVVHDFRLAPEVSEYLMNVGFVPGMEITVARSCPGGGPRVYRVDGTEVALRANVSEGVLVVPIGPEEPCDQL